MLARRPLPGLPPRRAHRLAVTGPIPNRAARVALSRTIRPLLWTAANSVPRSTILGAPRSGRVPGLSQAIWPAIKWPACAPPSRRSGRIYSTCPPTARTPVPLNKSLPSSKPGCGRSPAHGGLLVGGGRLAPRCCLPRRVCQLRPPRRLLPRSIRMKTALEATQVSPPAQNRTRTPPNAPNGAPGPRKRSRPVSSRAFSNSAP